MASYELETVDLGERFEAALLYATRTHALQRRAGSGTPYVAHLLGVASLTLEAGGDEQQAIAALLHDAVEDQGGAARLADIRARFGERVAAIVAACTDYLGPPDQRPPWRERKERYLAHLGDHDDGTLLVSCADKLFNARAIVADYRVHGEAVFARFSGGRAGVLWYYNALAPLYAGRAGALAEELRRTVAELNALANHTPP